MGQTFFCAALLFSFSTAVTFKLVAQEQTKSSAQRADGAAVSPVRGEKLQLAGIHNPGKVSSTLYRGGQPKTTESLAELKKLGVTTIVDLRGEGRERIEWEHKEAEALGIRFVQIPVSGWSPPSDAQVAQFLEILRSEPRQKVFVHCLFGDDRTGVFVATYRMTVEKWKPEEAMKEMYFFGFNGFWHPAMKKFIREFPEHLKSSPLASLREQSTTH